MGLMGLIVSLPAFRSPPSAFPLLSLSLSHSLRSFALRLPPLARFARSFAARSLFEGMKAYRSTKPSAKPSAKPVLFRPEMNMARMRRSAARVRLPVCPLPAAVPLPRLTYPVLLKDFDGDELIKCIKALIEVDKQMIPPPPHALYIRPTM